MCDVPVVVKSGVDDSLTRSMRHRAFAGGIAEVGEVLG